MSLNSLPDELIVEILRNLLDDPTSFRRFILTNKRFCHLANGSALINSLEWTRHRPNPFCLGQNLNGFDAGPCEFHGRCAEFHAKTNAKCEIMHLIRDGGKRKPLLRRVSAPLDQDLEENNDENATFTCYYHRLYCMLQTKYITFSSLKFTSARLSDRGCVRPLKDFSTRLKTNALVELELNECDMTLDWLNTILNELNSIAYLSLNNVTISDPALLVESKFMASKKLELLRISGDRSCRMNDSIFLYFLENFPATELDLTGTRVEYHKRIIQRFYSNASSSHIYSTKPSEYIFTFPMVMLYLKKYQTVVERFVADDTDITLAYLVRILQDEELKHLQVSVRNCPMITQFWRTRSFDRIDEQDLRRVIF